MQNLTEAIGRTRYLDGNVTGAVLPVLGPTSRIRPTIPGQDQDSYSHPISVVELQDLLLHQTNLPDSQTPVSVAPYTPVDSLAAWRYIKDLGRSHFRRGDTENRQGPVAGDSGKGGRGGDNIGVARGGAFEEPEGNGHDNRGLMTIVDFFALQDRISREKSGERIFDNSKDHWRPHYLVLMDAVWHHKITAYQAADMLATFHAGNQAESTFDHKLGIYNILGLDIRANEMFSHAARSGTPVTVGLIDLDLFKVVNDSYGHTVGDAVLKAVAKHWKGHMRPEDILGRFGGEEILFLLNMPIETALLVIERAQSTMTNAVRTELARKNIIITQPVTASIGCAVTNSLKADMSQEELLVVYQELQEQADSAMYVAKEYGRNRTINYHDLTQGEVELAKLLRQKK